MRRSELLLRDVLSGAAPPSAYTQALKEELAREAPAKEELPYARTQAEHTRTMLAKCTLVGVIINVLIQISYVLSKVL